VTSVALEHLGNRIVRYTLPGSKSVTGPLGLTSKR
jgi:hypothetical protein